MYKAKCNIACGDKFFKAGNEYSKKDISGLDVNDFDFVGKEEEKEVKPKSLTNASLKAKK